MSSTLLLPKFLRVDREPRIAPAWTDHDCNPRCLIGRSRIKIERWVCDLGEAGLIRINVYRLGFIRSVFNRPGNIFFPNSNFFLLTE